MAVNLLCQQCLLVFQCCIYEVSGTTSFTCQVPVIVWVFATRRNGLVRNRRFGRNQVVIKGVFDCTANNHKFAVGVGWCANNRTDPSETDRKFHCKQWRLTFDGSVKFWVGANSTRNLRCNRIRPKTQAQTKFLVLQIGHGQLQRSVIDVCKSRMLKLVSERRAVRVGARGGDRDDQRGVRGGERGPGGVRPHRVGRVPRVARLHQPHHDAHQERSAGQHLRRRLFFCMSASVPGRAVDAQLFSRKILLRTQHNTARGCECDLQRDFSKSV